MEKTDTSNKPRMFVTRIHSAIDVMTNSSAELFVGTADSKKMLIELVKAAYPEYEQEYEEPKSIDELTVNQLDTYISYYCSPHMWPASKSMYPILPGFTFEELYVEDGRGPAWNGEVQYKLIDNDRWRYVTEGNFAEIINKLDPERKMFFMFSHDENPNWEMQERLEAFMTRIHLG